SHVIVKIRAGKLKENFPNLHLDEITYEHLRQFKDWFAKQPTKINGKGTRSLASVHRSLATLRRMFSIAVQMKWMASNPFSAEDALINETIEPKRVRVLSLEEERRLHAALANKKNQQWFGFVLVAQD